MMRFIVKPVRALRFGGALSIALISFGLVGPGVAQDAPPAPTGTAPTGTEVRYIDLTQREQIGVIRALVENGQIAEAQLLLNGSVFDEADYGYQAAYLQAIVYRLTGQLEPAAVLLRQILAERPDFRLVRLELAQVLVLMDQADGAQFHLNILAEAAQDAGEREFFESAIDQITPDSRLSFSTFLTIAPSTNLNSGGGQRTIVFGPFTIPVGVNAESGIGGSYGGTAIYAIPLAEDRQLYFAGAVQINDYPNEVYDNQVVTGRVGLHVGPTTRRTTFELISDQRWVNGTSYDTGNGVRISQRLSLGDGMRLDGQLSFTDRDFRPVNDQTSYIAEVTFTKALSPRHGVSIGLSAEQTDVENSQPDSYDGFGIEFGTYRNFANGLGLAGTVEFTQREFRAVSALVGGVREDDITRVRLSGLYAPLQFRGVTPRLSLTWTNSSSNDPRYDYDARGAEISLTSSF